MAIFDKFLLNLKSIGGDIGKNAGLNSIKSFGFQSGSKSHETSLKPSSFYNKSHFVKPVIFYSTFKLFD